MKDLDLKTLRLLVAVCDHRNIARVAEIEHIEPSAISKRIAQMEAALDTQLLVRARRGVAPTPAALALLEHARTILFTMDRLQNDVAALARGVRGHVRLLATASAIAESLLDDVAAFMRHPDNVNIKVDIEERFSSDLVRMLRDGIAPVGVCWDNIDLQGLSQRPYRKDHLGLAVHVGHPLAGFESLRFEQALDYEHVGLPAAASVQVMLQRAAALAGRPLVHRVVVSNFDAALRVVAANLAISVIPLQVAVPHGKEDLVRIIPLSDAWARRRFVICFPSYDALQPAARRMVDHLGSTSGEQRST